MSLSFLFQREHGERLESETSAGSSDGKEESSHVKSAGDRSERADHVTTLSGVCVMLVRKGNHLKERRPAEHRNTQRETRPSADAVGETRAPSRSSRRAPLRQ